MKIIPSFKPAVSRNELKTIFLKILYNNGDDYQTKVFEDKFAHYIGVKHAIRAPSGRWALYYILENMELKKGDEVILPAFTYFAVPAAIIKLGLKPVFVDINSENLNIDVKKIKDNITEKTKVIIPTHLCGFTCELEEIMDLAERYNIKVIEDCAQSLGAEYKNKKTGAWGDAAYFSFGVTKNFTTLSGAMIATNNDKLANKIRQKMMTSETDNVILFSKLLQACVMKLASSPFLFPCAYYIMRIFSFFGIDIINLIFHEKKLLLDDMPETGLLNGIQAELGITQLNDLDRKNDGRMEKGSEFYESLKGARHAQIPLLETKGKNIFSGCPLLFKNKKNVRKFLLRKGIDVSAGYMQNCAKLEAFKEYKKECPNASRVEDEILYFPIYFELKTHELLYISKTIRQIAKN